MLIKFSNKLLTLYSQSIHICDFFSSRTGRRKKYNQYETMPCSFGFCLSPIVTSSGIFALNTAREPLFIEMFIFFSYIHANSIERFTVLISFYQSTVMMTGQHFLIHINCCLCFLFFQKQNIWSIH